MFVVRCTKKLKQRLGIELAVADPPASTTMLGEWYGNVVTHHRRQLVVLISGRTLLPVILPLAPSSSLPPRFVIALERVLLAIGVAEAKVRSELTEMEAWTFARTENRRVVGSLTDFAWLLDAVPPEETLLEAALGLADAPCSPIGGVSPKEATRDLFGAREDRRLH